MKSVYIEAVSLDDAWHQLLYNNNQYGRRYKITSGSFTGDDRVEFDFVSGFITHPHERPLAPRMPESSSLPVPTTDENINEYFANYIMDPNLSPGEEYRYSSWINGQLLSYPEYCVEINCKFLDSYNRLRCNQDNKSMTHDYICPKNKPNTQLAWIIHHFKTAGLGNNHCFIQIGDSTSSLAYERPCNDCISCGTAYEQYISICPKCNVDLVKNETRRGTSPCLRGLDFKVKDNKLITAVNFRSWDLYSGFPENMGGFILLNEYIAAEIGVDPGPLAFSSAGLHCYGFQLDIVKSRFGKV